MSQRLDIFEPGDQTALVCVDVPEMQNLIVEQLSELKYKIQTGISAEDLILKMRTHVYDVIVISEHFEATKLETNPLLIEAVSAPATNRHRQFLVLVGPSVRTSNEWDAFQHSVDLTIALDDVIHLRALMRRGLARWTEFYNPFREVLAAAGLT